MSQPFLFPLFLFLILFHVLRGRVGICMPLRVIPVILSRNLPQIRVRFESKCVVI